MADHKIQVTLDEATGEVRVRHFCTVTLAGVPVVTHEDVTPPGGLGDALASLLGANRAEVESRATVAAARHVAAVSGRAPGRQLKLTGGVTPGGTEVKG